MLPRILITSVVCLLLVVGIHQGLGMFSQFVSQDGLTSGPLLRIINLFMYMREMPEDYKPMDASMNEALLMQLALDFQMFGADTAYNLKTFADNIERAEFGDRLDNITMTMMDCVGDGLMVMAPMIREVMDSIADTNLKMEKNNGEL